MANKYHSDVKSPIYEMITYYPGIMDTTDLEAATKTITATAEASGTAIADYTKTLTLPAPIDARIAILSIASRLSVTIDSDAGTHDLRCRVYVDTQHANNLLFDLTCTTLGNQLAVVGLTSGTIFTLLKNGAAHTLYFFFWSPANQSPVISVVQAWWGPGSVKSSAWGTRVLTFTSTPACELQARFYHVPVGTGGQSMHFVITNNTGNQYAGLFGTTETGLVNSVYPTDSGYGGMTWQMLPAGHACYFCLFGSAVATSAYFIIGITFFIQRWD